MLQGSDDECVVTRCAWAEEKASLETAQLGSWTRGCSHANPEEEPLFEIDLMKKLNLTFFEVVGRSWEVRIDLLEVVKEAALQCGTVAALNST